MSGLMSGFLSGDAVRARLRGCLLLGLPSASSCSAAAPCKPHTQSLVSFEIVSKSKPLGMQGTAHSIAQRTAKHKPSVHMHLWACGVEGGANLELCMPLLGLALLFLGALGVLFGELGRLLLQLGRLLGRLDLCHLPLDGIHLHRILRDALARRYLLLPDLQTPCSEPSPSQGHLSALLRALMHITRTHCCQAGMAAQVWQMD